MSEIDRKIRETLLSASRKKRVMETAISDFEVRKRKSSDVSCCDCGVITDDLSHQGECAKCFELATGIVMRDCPGLEPTGEDEGPF